MGDPRDGIPFGAYRLIKRLARGGMAEVFLATQRGPEGFERRVAVKRILPHLVESADFVAMFLDEARLAARLAHPNVVHIYEFGKFEDYYFIAMEHVDGVDTNRMIVESAGRGVPPEIVARLGADAAGGLHHAHQLPDADGHPLEIVHRDISPQNLIVSYDGVLKIVDFGIAKAARHAERTRPGVVKGKFAYMSPEQVVGKSLDGKSDIYSLGLVLWELLAGRYAVSRENPAVAMREIRDGRIPPIETVKEVPPALAAILGRALSQKREQRPSAAQFALELEAFLKSEPKLATAMVVAEWMKGRWPRQETTAAGSPGTERVPRTALGTEEDRGATADLSAAAFAAPSRPAPVAPARRPGSAPPRLEPLPARIPTPLISSAPFAALVAPRPLPLGRLFAAVLGLAAAAAVIYAKGGPAELLRMTVVTQDLAAQPILVEPAEVPAAEPLLPPSAEPLPASAPALATLEVITNPAGAGVVFDGVPLIGVTPLLVPDVETGDHAVVVTLADHRSETRRLALGAGEKYRLELALRETQRPQGAGRRPRPAQPQARGAARPSTGYLTVRTVPWSDVYLGGRMLGQSPLAEREIPAGTHTVVFKGPFGRRAKRVTIRPGDTTKLSLDFRSEEQ